MFAGALSGANKGVETPPKGNSGRYECLSESPVQMTPRKSTAKRRLSDGQPQVLRPVDQAQIGHRSSQLTTLVRVVEAELGLGGSPAKKQRMASPVQKLSPEKREEMETVVSPPEEVLATPLPEAEEGEILSDGERSDWTTIPTSREERERKEAKKQKKRSDSSTGPQDVASRKSRSISRRRKRWRQRSTTAVSSSELAPAELRSTRRRTESYSATGARDSATPRTPARQET